MGELSREVFRVLESLREGMRSFLKKQLVLCGTSSRCFAVSVCRNGFVITKSLQKIFASDYRNGPRRQTGFSEWARRSEHDAIIFCILAHCHLGGCWRGDGKKRQRKGPDSEAGLYGGQKWEECQTDILLHMTDLFAVFFQIGRNKMIIKASLVGCFPDF